MHAPEFPDGLVWLNGGSLMMRKLAGKPVLIDFWTYSCVNCQRTLPHLKRWHETYAKLGLTIIGVHTPEFAFEKEEKNVAKAIKRYDIPYPVVLDNDYAVWNLYANRWWPRKFLVDKDGVIVYDHVGEGGYAETEHAIQQALMDCGVKKFPDVPPDSGVGGAVCYRTTPELYLGYLRGVFGNAGQFLPDAEEAFTDMASEHDDDVPYLHGHWRIANEYVEHVKTLSAATEYLLLKYSAFGANLVLGAEKACEVDIELDGLPLGEDMMGDDVIMKGGRSVVMVKEARMYRLTKAQVYHRATLKLKVKTAGLRMYAFTFEGCAV